MARVLHRPVADFGWRLQHQRQRVQARIEFGSQGVVDQPVPRDPVETFETGRHDSNIIVRLPAGTRTGMASMLRTVIDDIERYRMKDGKRRTNTVGAIGAWCEHAMHLAPLDDQAKQHLLPKPSDAHIAAS